MENLKFETLSFSKISERIEEKIKEVILNGKLKTGDRLPTEKEMALQFGVSSVTLREALRALEILGLIVKKKGRGGGIFVSEINNESIKTSLGHFLIFKKISVHHLYEVRKIMEPPTVKLAAQKITSDEIKKLEENVSYCEKKLVETSPFFDEKEFFEIDNKNVDFHRIIAESAHNPILSLTIDFIFDFLRECEAKILFPDIRFSTDTVKDHRNILEYLKKGEGEKCEKEMILHLKKLDEYLIDVEKRLDQTKSLHKGEDGGISEPIVENIYQHRRTS